MCSVHGVGRLTVDQTNHSASPTKRGKVPINTDLSARVKKEGSCHQSLGIRLQKGYVLELYDPDQRQQFVAKSIFYFSTSMYISSLNVHLPMYITHASVVNKYIIQTLRTINLTYGTQ